MNNDPVYWKGNRFQIVKFGIWAAIGTFLSTFVIFTYIESKGYPLEQEVTLYFLFGGILVWLFSRIVHLISLGPKFFQNPKKYLLETGLYNQGGLIAGFLVAWIAVWKLQLPWVVALDALAVGASCGLFFGRIGCYAYGCCWGRETHEPYGVVYLHDGASVVRQKPHLKGQKLYPTQLMTSFINALLFFLSLFLLYINVQDGLIFLVFVVGQQGARLWLEYYRDDMNFDEGRNYTTIVMALLLFSLGFSLLLLTALEMICIGCAPIPRQDLWSSLTHTLGNFNVWKGATVITLTMGILLGLHGKKLGSW